MCMGKPIITSNLSFAETVCRDAALYFNPMSIESIVECIETLLNNPWVGEELVLKGYERLSAFGTAHDRAMGYINICREILKREK